MSQIRISEAARFLGVSDDTIRRWLDNGTLHALPTASGPAVVDGLELANLARERAVEQVLSHRADN